MKTGNDWEAGFKWLWNTLEITEGLPLPMREFGFRKWRFDFAWPELRIAVEIHGATTARRYRGRHNTARGIRNDAEKSREAQKAGWIVLTFTGEDMAKRPVPVIEEVVEVVKGRMK